MKETIVFALSAMNVFFAITGHNPTVVALNWATACFCFGIGISISIMEK
jgi:hypothetical protein